jgi:hypothetical protein
MIKAGHTVHKTGWQLQSNSDMPEQFPLQATILQLCSMENLDQGIIDSSACVDQGINTRIGVQFFR